MHTTAPSIQFILSIHEDIHAGWAEGLDWRAGPGETVEMGPAWWTVQADVKCGDIMLMYVAHPKSGIYWLARARSNAFKPAKATSHYSYAWLDLVQVSNPVTWEWLTGQEALAEWGPIKQGFAGWSRAVKDPGACSIVVNELIRLNPSLSEVLDDWVARGAEPLEDPTFHSDEFTGGMGNPYPWFTERQMQKDYADGVLLHETVCRPSELDPPVPLKMLEAVIGPDSRADIIVGDFTKEPTLLVLFEMKLFATTAAIEQAVRYRSRLEALRLPYQVECIVCALSFAPEALSAAKEADIGCRRLAWLTHEDCDFYEAATPAIDVREMRADLDAGEFAWFTESDYDTQAGAWTPRTSYGFASEPVVATGDVPGEPNL